MTVNDPYASVAETYDLMVDWPARLTRERPFFTQLIAERPTGRVLDVGCGTGHHTRLFAELGAAAVGIDPSIPMIERARALHPGANPSFLPGAFADIPTIPGAFELVAILGNTLAYVADQTELSQTLTAARERLAAGGRLVVQVVNYDSLRAQGARLLPLIARTTETREYLFIREYRMVDGMAEFMLLTLTREDNAWTQRIEHSRHFPITESQMRAALGEAGFASAVFYGDYQRTPYAAASSPNLVVVAEIG